MKPSFLEIKNIIESNDSRTAANIINRMFLDDKDGDWISPLESEREVQEKRLKEIYPEYPNIVKWQIMNGFLFDKNRTYDDVKISITSCPQCNAGTLHKKLFKIGKGPVYVMKCNYCCFIKIIEE